MIARQVTALWLETWRDHWRSIAGWAIGLIALVAVMMAVYPSIRSTSASMEEYIQAMPEAFRSMFRLTDYSSGPGYLGAELFSFMVPMVFIGVGVTWGAAATAGEEQAGTADLLLALPVSRDRVIVTRMLALVALLLGLALVMWAALVVGAEAAELTVGGGGLLAASLMSGLLGCLFAALALLVGALTGRRGAALGVSIAAALAAFLVYTLGPLVDWLEGAVRYTPFQWAYGNEPLRNGFDLGYTALTLGLTVGLSIAAAVAFRRRDIGT